MIYLDINCSYNLRLKPLHGIFYLASKMNLIIIYFVKLAIGHGVMLQIITSFIFLSTCISKEQLRLLLIESESQFIQCVSDWPKETIFKQPFESKCWWASVVGLFYSGIFFLNFVFVVDLNNWWLFPHLRKMPFPSLSNLSNNVICLHVGKENSR